jgi:hypothetical protein
VEREGGKRGVGKLEALLCWTSSWAHSILPSHKQALDRAPVRRITTRQYRRELHLVKGYVACNKGKEEVG